MSLMWGWLLITYNNKDEQVTNCKIIEVWLVCSLFEQPGRICEQDLNWEVRYKMCLGVAQGLHYLHEIAQPRIIHRDIKASNILLDKHMNPKIADFGPCSPVSRWREPCQYIAHCWDHVSTNILVDLWLTRISMVGHSIWVQFGTTEFVWEELTCTLWFQLIFNNCLLWMQGLYGSWVCFPRSTYRESGCLQLWSIGSRDFKRQKEYWPEVVNGESIPHWMGTFYTRVHLNFDMKWHSSRAIVLLSFGRLLIQAGNFQNLVWAVHGLLNQLCLVLFAHQQPLAAYNWQSWVICL